MVPYDTDRNKDDKTTAQGKSTWDKNVIFAAVMTSVVTLIGAYLAYLGAQTTSQAGESAQQLKATALATTSPRMANVGGVISPTTPLMHISRYVGLCSLSVVMPGNLDPEKDLITTSEQVNKGYANNEWSAWRELPGVAIGDVLSIESDSTNRDWMQLSNTSDALVDVEQQAPEHVDVVISPGGCGGAINIRGFSAINLEQGSTAYTRKVTTTDADLFTLQPGEPESWNLPVSCKALGTYHVTLEIAYIYQQIQGKYSYSLPEYVCPQSYSTWAFWNNSPLVFAGSYEWDGAKYNKTR
ncbi:MAG TPA: hypothetical protein VGE04_01335 [Chloroflexia bacterium]|jgi:hypothetical protein